MAKSEKLPALNVVPIFAKDALQEFEKVKKASSIVPSPYAYVKKWFLKNYPDYLEIVEEAGEEAIEQAAAKQEPLFESIFTIDEGTEQNTEGGVA